MTAPNLLPRKSEKRLGKEDSVRLRVYNTTLLENIKDVVNSSYISEELEKLEVPILSVRMAGDLSVARVYWQASGNAESDDKVQTVLDSFTGRIRHELISLRVMGNVPRVCFLKDKAAANIAEIDRLLATADFGPSDEDDNTSLDGSQHPHEKFYEEEYPSDVGTGNARVRKGEEPPGSYQGGKSHFAVDHANVMDQISRMKKKEESSGTLGDGFAPITDSIERFKVVQKRKRAKKGDREDDTVYRGQLQEEYSARNGEDYSNLP